MAEECVNSRQWQEFLFLLSSVLGTTQPAIRWTPHLVTSEQSPLHRRPNEHNFAGSVIQCSNHPDNGVQANVTLLTFDQLTYTMLLNTTSNYHQIRNSPSPTFGHTNTKEVSERTACVQDRKLPLSNPNKKKLPLYLCDCGEYFVLCGKVISDFTTVPVLLYLHALITTFTSPPSSSSSSSSSSRS